jgi:hypothetical protein
MNPPLDLLPGAESAKRLKCPAPRRLGFFPGPYDFMASVRVQIMRTPGLWTLDFGLWTLDLGLCTSS